MPVIPPFPFRRMKTPVFYRMTCPNCGFERQYELENDHTVYNNDPDGGRPRDPELVKELPAVCPQCGAKLKKEEIPVRIFH